MQFVFFLTISFCLQALTFSLIDNGRPRILDKHGGGNDDLSFDDFSSPPVEQESPVINSTPSARPNQKRSKNFSEQEDQLLVSAWLNISTDPIQGTNQTKGSFWTRVYDYYHSNKEFTSDRSQSSLLHRWKGILVNVNKFCGCVTRIEGRNQSGVTIQDKVIHCIIGPPFFILMHSGVY